MRTVTRDPDNHVKRRAKRDGRLLGGWPEGRIPLASKPDFDNIAKAVCDGVTRAGLWPDDARVCDGRVVKCRAAMGEPPHTEVTVREWVHESPSTGAAW